MIMRVRGLVLLVACLGWFAEPGVVDGAKVIFIAGTPSHGPGEHEYRAGCLLLQRCLEQTPGLSTIVYSNGWPAAADALNGADSIVLSMDGSAHHALLEGNHLAQLGAIMAQGTGLVCLHWAVEPTLARGEKEMLQWLGGAFEVNWSVNPIWTADFSHLPIHPITRGVAPFQLTDEWYFHLRFPQDMRGVTPILAAVPPASTMSRPDDAHAGNPAVRESVKQKEPQTVAWAFERPGGGRGFGFTGAHYHTNWANPNFRKIVLNAICWTAHIEVPSNGVESEISPGELTQNLDPKKSRKRK